MMAMFVANLPLTAWPYRAMLALQMVVYAMAGVGVILANRGHALKLLSAPYTFLVLNTAACVALFKLVTGSQTHIWEKR